MKNASTLRVRYFLAFWLFVLSAVAFLDRTNISIAGLQISRQYGLSNQALGWIFSSFLIGYAGFQIPAGWLSARFGPRIVLTTGVLLWGTITAATALLPSVLEHALLFLLAIRFALGASESVIYPAANQFVARWIPVRERGFINGLIFAGVGAGSGLTPPLLNWLITRYTWRSAFWFSAVLGFIAALVWWWMSRDTPRQHPAMSSSELREIELGLNLAGPQPSESPSSESGSGDRPDIFWRAIFTRRDLPALIVGYFSFGYIAWIFFSWFYIYMTQARGMNLRSSADFAMLPFLSMTVCCLLGGAMSDELTRKWGLRTGRCRLASASLFATAVFLVIGAYARGPQLAAVILAGGAGVLYISQSSFWSVSVEIAGSNSGVFSSIINMGAQIGGAVTASLTPWIAQRYGWTMSFSIAAGLAVLSGLCWLTVRPDVPLKVGSLSASGTPKKIEGTSFRPIENIGGIV
jgi:ACS family glucarate transporter-like MFS transporter